MTRLFVGNLPYEATENELRAWFVKAGIDVRAVSLQVDRFTGGPRGFAYVDINGEEASAAVRSCNGRTFLGRTLVIDAQYNPSPDLAGAASTTLRLN